MQEMPNAKSYKTGAEKILAVGTTGGGKTAGILTLPGKKFVYAFDPNCLQTLQGHDVDYEEFLPEALDMNAVTLKSGVRDTFTRPKEPLTYVDFEAHFMDALDKGFFDQYDVIGFDSMTTYSSLVMDRIMWLNQRFGKWPEQADWTATMNTITNGLRTITALPGKTIYVTAHIEFKQDETTSKMQNILSLIGRLRNSLPLLFSEVWLFKGDVGTDGKSHFFVQTAPDRYSPFLRSTIRGLEFEEDVTIPPDKWNDPVGYGIGALLTGKPRSKT